MAIKAGNAAKKKLLKMQKLAHDLGEHFSYKKLGAHEEYIIEATIVKAIEDALRLGLAKRFKVKQ